jgi:hypothetical protein
MRIGTPPEAVTSKRAQNRNHHHPASHEYRAEVAQHVPERNARCAARTERRERMGGEGNPTAAHARSGPILPSVSRASKMTTS